MTTRLLVLSTVLALFLQVSAPARQVFADEPREYYLRLSEDRDPVIRAQAARALRAYIGEQRVLDRLLKMSQDSWETLPVRLEAVKSLSRSDAREASEALLRVGKTQGVPSLQQVSMQALYRAASANVGVRQELIRALSREFESLEMRNGAAWALFMTSGEPESQAVLLRAAADDTQAQSTRIEALKSLFGAMGNADVLRATLRLAQDTWEAQPVRVAAILLLQPVNSAPEVGEFLKRMISDTFNSPELRSAAMEAMASQLSEQGVRYFHLASYAGVERDPLDY